MPLPFTGLKTSIKLRGEVIPGAADRQQRIAGFDQAVFSQSNILCIGAGGIVSQVAPTLVRKGIGRITLLDDDIVEPSNLNRQRFYINDVGEYKAVALARNLQRESIAGTEIVGVAYRIEDAIGRGLDLGCEIAICGVDNNPARVTTSRYFRSKEVPVIFVAVSQDADHGYVFVQDKRGPCIACLLPDIGNDERYPCPGTPAITDILQAVGAIAVYAVDTILMARSRKWNYRRLSLSDPVHDGGSWVPEREGCSSCEMEKATNDSIRADPGH